MRSLIRLGNHDGWIGWIRYGVIGGKCLSLGNNNALPSSETEPRANNLAVVNLHSYPLTAASWDGLQRDETPFIRFGNPQTIRLGYMADCILPMQ